MNYKLNIKKGYQLPLFLSEIPNEITKKGIIFDHDDKEDTIKAINNLLEFVKNIKTKMAGGHH